MNYHHQSVLYAEVVGAREAETVAKAILHQATRRTLTQITDMNGTTYSLTEYLPRHRMLAKKVIADCGEGEAFLMALDMLLYSHEKTLEDEVENVHESETNPIPSPRIRCAGCGEIPEKIPEYKNLARINQIPPAEVVKRYEGTYNPKTHRFLCSECYIKAGMPLGMVDAEEDES